MAQFRNIENDGNWVQGGTYTFEFLLESQNDSREDGYASGWYDVFITDVVIPAVEQPGGDAVYLGHWRCESGLGGSGPAAFVDGTENTNPCPYPNTFDAALYIDGVPYGGFTSQSYDPIGNILFHNGIAIPLSSIVSTEYVDENMDWQRATITLSGNAILGDATVSTEKVYFLGFLG